MAANGNGDRKRKASVLDEQFDFPHIPDWRQGQKQKVLGCKFFVHKPINEIIEQPQQIDFEIKDPEDVWAFGPNTRFKVAGQFQSKDGTGAWTPVGADELDKVMVVPDWLDFLIKNIDIFHGNMRINSSDEGRYVAPYLNAWKYNFMNKDQKKELCPQEACPGFGVPSKKGDAGGWSMTDANSEWRTGYGKQIFVGPKRLSFDYVPLDFWPIFQGSNYMEEAQKILPMPLVDKITIRIVFHDNMECIFKKAAADNNKKYRFMFTDFSLVAEHLRLGKAFKTQLLNKKGQFAYPGVTRILRTETISQGNTTHKVKVQSVPLPEGLFIFAVPNKVLSGTYTYQDNTDGNVFRPHNIADVNFTFGEQKFFIDEPHIGMINNDIIESKIFNDYLRAAPFGLKMDKDKITLANIRDGGINTPYPNVFVNLCNYGDKSRIVPAVNDGSILTKDLDLDINITFKDGGAPADVTFIIYLYYTDNNLTLDTKHKGHAFFTSPYVKLI